MKVTVLGAGNGAYATAADWALGGHTVNMFNSEKHESALDFINEQGGIYTVGDIEGFAKLAYVGTDMQRAIEGSELIIAVGPACSNEPFANAVKHFIRGNQVYIISPGSNGGALVTKKIFEKCENAKDVLIAETATLPYAARIIKPGTVKIYLKLIGGLYLSAIPFSRTDDALRCFRQGYPFAQAGESIFRTILQNANPIIHPAITVMNTSLIERTGGDFSFYEEGVTPAVGRLIEALDLERIEIGRALGLSIINDPEISVQQGYMTEANYSYGYTRAPGFKGIRAQESLKHRYLDEDVGYGLVFLAELGKSIGVKTPIMDSLIMMASVIADRDYRGEAIRTLEGIGYTVKEVQQL